MKYTLIATLSLALAASARPSFVSSKRAEFTLKNGQDAIALNDKFKTLTASSSCTAGENACVNDQFAQCVNGKFVLQSCGSGLICAALPLVNSAGTSITCTTAADRDARIAATGATAATGGNNASNGNAAATTTSAAASASGSAAAGNNASNGAAAGGDPQTSTTLSQDAIQEKYAQDGTNDPSAGPGQEASLTSTNNFINFCLQFPDKQKTNGQQVLEGSCNQTPMGLIAAKANMPSAKFQSPTNGAVLPANKDIAIQLAINNLETGHFTNPTTTFHMAPQTVNAQGLIKGHSHVVIEPLSSVNQTAPTDPTGFVFFKGLNGKAENGVLTTTVDGGLPAGAYRIATINSAANHQPALVAVAQRGALDDMVYFTVA